MNAELQTPRAMDDGCRARSILALLMIPLCVGLSEGLAWWWMKGGKPRSSVVPDYHFPRDRYGYDIVPVEASVARALAYDHASSGTIAAGSGRRIQVFYFEWNSTEVNGCSEAFGHAPEVCMSASGFQFQGVLPQRHISVGGLNLLFDATRFRNPAGAPVFVYKLVWAEGMAGINPMRERGGLNAMQNRRFVIQSVLQRWRPRHARVLMLGVEGVANDGDAWRLVEVNVLGDIQQRTIEPEEES